MLTIPPNTYVIGIRADGSTTLDTTPQPNPNAGPYIVPMNRHERRKAAAKRRKAKL